MTAILDWLGASRYYEHAVCLTNDHLIMTLYIASDMMTAVSFLIIGVCLWLYRDRGIALNGTHCLLFAAFTVGCALTHVTGTVVLFSGLYRLDVAMRAGLAGISITTALMTVLYVIERRAAERVVA